ncbi:HAD-IC family P-type ATPase [Streptomyces sp. NPDC047525]|uniref:HAD-IC family P-type ATPase n=1 Tax=Streptomyces sp. NPDC047525 TaxID=3155264 RepID=UPI0034090DFF
MLRRVDSGPRGLTDEEAERRVARFGENTLPDRRAVSWPRLFGRSMRDPFTAVLLCLGLVSATVASWGTACVILCLVVVSGVLRTSGEHRADRSMAALRALVATTATVLRRAERDGDPQEHPQEREIPVEELVPGDVVRLGPGDLVPADVRLLRASGLSVRQAALTGESAPVPKAAADVPGPRRPEGAFDQPHLCFQGSSVASGSGTAVVVATGERTRFAAAQGLAGRRGLSGWRGLSGRRGLSGWRGLSGQRGLAGKRGLPGWRGQSEQRGLSGRQGLPGRRGLLEQRGLSGWREPSAFDRSVHGISWVLIRFMLLTPPLVLMANAALRGRGLETLPFAVAVAVGLTPEMLPVIVTTCLARGASLLARTHGVIVKRLPALHDLGAVDVLCLDKTGTLTEDRPVLDRALGADGRAAPEALHWAAVNSWWTLQLAELPAPDPLDDAVLDAADEEEALRYDGVAALPFDSVRRIATAVVRRPGSLGTHTLVVKGAAEDVLERCVLEDGERARLLSVAADEAASGLRVLAVATAERPARTRAYTAADERGLTFRGFLTLRDALAPTAATALRDLAQSGITVKILTGDHPGTAARACRELGIGSGQVLTADRLDSLTDAELAETARRTTVFARCTPEHKARITAALRSCGHTTGFLGDGVNDLPALRAADVGIAPRAAVDVVRESADVVLADKDLTAIDQAVLAGRHSSGNIATYLRVTLSSNLGNVIAMLSAGLLLPFLPMLPAQVLVQNLCFDAAQVAFAYERPHPAVLRRPTVLRPRAFLRFITGFGALNALADLATFLVLALALHGPGAVDDQAVFHSGWFTENLLTQALVMLLLRTGRRRAEGRTPGPVGWSVAALAAVGLLLPLSPLGPLLGMTALPGLYYLLLAVVLGLYAVALEALRRRWDAQP